MFGYITVDRAELKGKDLSLYQMYYCGVCRELKKRCGERARLTLTYDMTFLAILLTALYEGSVEPKKEFCILHPASKKSCIENAYTAYAADMNLLLVYHNLEDDWRDEHKKRSYAFSRMLRKPYLRTAARYPRQVRAIRKYLKALHQVEEGGNASLDMAAGLTGELFAEIYMMRRDIWSQDLREVGFYLGKFIYLMDAWDDVEKDRRNGSYNPFLRMAEEPAFEENAQHVLTMMAARAARAFERLPVVENVDILRNILYSGIWVKYRRKKCEKNRKSCENIDGRDETCGSGEKKKPVEKDTETADADSAAGE